MSRYSVLKKCIIAVQIIALMVCTVTSGTIFSVAEEVVPDDDGVIEQPTTSAETVVTTAAGTETLQTQAPSGELTDYEKASVQALQEQRAAIIQQAQALQQTRQQYSDSLADLLLQQENIEEQISLKQREIDINAQLKESINTQLNLTDEQMIEQEQSMLVLRQSILSRFEALRQKLRVLSKGGQLTTVQMIASSDSYTSYLINSKMASRMSSMDQNLIQGLEDELSTIETQRTLLEMHQNQLETQKSDLETAEADLESSKDQLLDLLAEAETISEQLNNHITYYRQQYLTLSQQQSQIQQQITSITNEYDPGSAIAAEIMSWPAPECSVITSSFKARWGRWHYGIDIAAWGDSTGKSVIAAADGTVIFSGSDNSGYGKYVIIDHGYDIDGNRIVTLYGHCSELYAQKGDVVFGGQTLIAAVGNTGNSTGPHLHFEVRVNGSAVDPVGNGYVLTNGITIAG